MNREDAVGWITTEMAMIEAGGSASMSTLAEHIDLLGRITVLPISEATKADLRLWVVTEMTHILEDHHSVLTDRAVIAAKATDAA